MTTSAGPFLAIALLVLAALIIAGALVWRRRRVLSPELKVLKPLLPESRFVDIDGTRIHYVQAGRGSDVVLLHGIGASIFIWRFLFPLLERRHRLTAIDLPGFGQSSKEARRDYGLDAQAEIVAAALGKLGLEKPILVGSSMGGAIALWMAKRFPGRFSRVVALAPATDFSLVPWGATHFRHATPFFRRTLNRRTMRLLIARLVTRQALVTEEVIDAYLAPFLDRGESVRAFWSALSLLSDRRLPSSLEGLEAEVLVVYGQRDLLVPRKSIDGLLKRLRRATLVLHDSGGHHIMEDEPEWIARLIEDFSARN